ncbi:UNVERIFIED_CONTAM: hypothetical protein GTU68_021148, partial [Idotea baltica]|nr:hypothetical protein [Idotea baltica]
KGLQKYSFRGYTPDQLYELNQEQLVELFRARQRRRFDRSILLVIQKLSINITEKPTPVKTRLRDCIIMPEMVGNFVGVYNGKVYNNVEVKFDMIGRYLGEFSLTYRATRHGKAGVGATKGSAHSSLK